jgi:nicotinamide riboside transporter PnuC
MVNSTLMWGGLLLLVGAVASVMGADDREEVNKRLKSVAWGAGLSLLGWVLYTWYTFDEITGFFGWLVSDGLVLVGLLVLGFAGYVWQEAARKNPDDPSAMIRTLQTATAGPVQSVVGILMAIVVTVATFLFTTGSAFADVFGVFGGIVAEAPMVIANLLTIGLGAIGLGWDVPLLDVLFPAWLEGMPLLWWFGLTLTFVGIATAVREAE